MKKFRLGLAFAFALAITALCFVSAPSIRKAIAQTCSWNFTGASTATYCGNVVSVGTTTAQAGFVGSITVPKYTFAQLPAACSEGQLGWLSDTVMSGAATFHGTPTNGGSTAVHSLISCSASNAWQYD